MKLHKSECHCDKCIDLCITCRPCWGSPRQWFKILITFPHLVNRIGKDYYDDEDDSRIELLAGAIPECDVFGNYPWWPVGKCQLLDANNLCMIHDYKPIEGQVSMGCKDIDSYELHHTWIVNSWNTKYGRKIIDMYDEMKGNIK